MFEEWGACRVFRRDAIGAACCVGAMFFVGLAEARPPIACGALHSIERGDTLFRIAERAYGDGWNYKRIYAANNDLLPNEQSVEIGDQILVPCLDGTGPASRREALAQVSQAAESDTVAADEMQFAEDRLPVEAEITEQTDPFEAFRQSVASLVLSVSLGGSAVMGPQLNASYPDDKPVNRSLRDGGHLDDNAVFALPVAP
jgi:hypothetical protein